MIEQLLLSHGYLILFFGTMIEADATLLTASFLAHRGYFPILSVLIIAALSSATVSHFAFYLARWRGRAIFARKSASDQRWHRLQEVVYRRGPWLLLVARFVWGLRMAIVGACAASGVRPVLFSLVDLTASCIWATVIGLCGYYFGHGLTRFFGDIRHHEKWIAAGLFAALVIFFWRWHRREMIETASAFRHPAEHSIYALDHLEEKLERHSRPKE